MLVVVLVAVLGLVAVLVVLVEATQLAAVLVLVAVVARRLGRIRRPLRRRCGLWLRRALLMRRRFRLRLWVTADVSRSKRSRCGVARRAL